MKNLTKILLMVFTTLVCVTSVSAWEPPEDFDWAPPYEIVANCGGGCHVQFGLVWLDNNYPEDKVNERNVRSNGN